MRAIEAPWLRDTEKCIKLADILTKLSDVELFCAQNWGRETIAYVSMRPASPMVRRKYMPSEPHGEGDIAVELWKKLEPGEK